MASPNAASSVRTSGGFIALWLVKLLSRGYAVHATLRDPCDTKNAHMKQQLDDDKANLLRLFKADVLDLDELTHAVQGCDGGRLPPRHSEVMDPAVKGTLNVLKACSAAKVQKVVVMSSNAAVHANPDWPQTDSKMRVAGLIYCCKDYGRTGCFRICREKWTECCNTLPSVGLWPDVAAYGEYQQQIPHLFYESWITEGLDVMNNTLWPIVDVRDVAKALLLVYEKPESSGRYICSAHHICTKDLLGQIFCFCNIPEVEHKAPLTSLMLMSLGWKPRRLEETLSDSDSVECYENEPQEQPEITPPPPCRRRVCVTGAGGYIGSWLVKLLLSRGFAVHATVRDPDDPKNEFLKQLENAPSNLQLFKADVLDYGTLTSAFAGCEGVFHSATPVPEHKTKEMLGPAVKGTRNVLEACSAASVKKLVVVSSIGAVCFNPSLPPDRKVDETCWSDKKFCKEFKNWYCLAKTEAEEIALEYGQKNGLHVITVCPGLVFGPLLQTVILNTSSKVLLYIIKGGPDAMMNKFFPIVDVRDVADASLLVYENAGPSERFICAQDQMDTKDLVVLMKSIVVDVDSRVDLTSEKLKKLGWKPMKHEETLADSVEFYRKAGFLDDEPCRLPYIYRINPDSQE
uniref:NAD-dependent epimerase/dehydratase domain-containing protein n=1 Tax=Leersia perrieri TaxID=77586 RepID=A0A0D9XF61_9ORYZ